ncbi:MAG: DUF4339 domain-containing protein [Sandaracinaceae bacterium]|nr:DUF4339 domain-containing protein [Sandaracinaceae bacterium]
MRWYLNRTGTAEGPFDEPTIVGMIGRGEIMPNAQICAEGAQAWQPLSAHPPFAQPAAPPQPQFQAAPQQPQAQAAPYQPAPQQQQFEQAAHQVAGGVADAANAFAGAVSGPGGLVAPQFGGAPQMAAPGEGFFEQAKARNEPISEEAKKAASMAHLLAAGGVFLGCWACGLGGVLGAFVSNMLYKESPKSPFAQFHINQAFQTQLVLWGANLAIAIVVNVLSFGLGMISPTLGSLVSFLGILNALLFFAAIVLPLLQFGKAKNGEWSEYPMFGGRVMRAKSPMLK